MTITTRRIPRTLGEAQAAADALEAERQALLSSYGLTAPQITAKRERLRELSQLLDTAWADVRRLKHAGKRGRGLG